MKKALTWILDGIRYNRKLDRLNRELALQDALEFEEAVRLSVARMRADQRALNAQHRVLKRAVKAL